MLTEGFKAGEYLPGINKAQTSFLGKLGNLADLYIGEIVQTTGSCNRPVNRQFATFKGRILSFLNGTVTVVYSFQENK